MTHVQLIFTAIVLKIIYIYSFNFTCTQLNNKLTMFHIERDTATSKMQDKTYSSLKSLVSVELPIRKRFVMHYRVVSQNLTRIYFCSKIIAVYSAVDFTLIYPLV